MTRPRTAVIYARFSSDLQQDRSIGDQVAACRDVAKRENLKVIETFADRAKSGSTMTERDELCRLVEAARAKQFDTVIVEGLDRLSRDQEDTARLYKQLTFNGVQILAKDQGVVTPLHVGLGAIMNSQFLATLGNKVRRGFDGRVREGKIPGPVAYGYRCIQHKPGEREIEPDQAKVVVRIFTEYAQGKSPRAIAKGLDDDKIPSPNTNRRNSTAGGAWNSQGIIGGGLTWGMLENPIYRGEIVWNTTRQIRNPETGKVNKRKNPESEWLRVDAPQLRIVDQSLWDAANKVRMERAARNKPAAECRHRANNIEHLLTGLLRCGACGGNMRIAGRQANGNTRITCTRAHRYSTCDHRKTYELENLEAAILDGMRTRLQDPQAIAEAAREYHARFADRQKRRRFDVAGLRKQLAEAEAQVARIVTVITEVDGPVKELSAKLKAVAAERDSLTEQLRLAEAESKVIELHPEVIKNYCMNVEKFTRLDKLTPLEKRAAFRTLIDHVVVHPTEVRQPYEFTPYGRLGGLLEADDLFPGTGGTKQKAGSRQLLSRQVGVSRLDEVATAVVPLGRWRAGA